MIVCVFLVSNSLGCCLRPRDHPARRDTTLGRDQEHTHTIMFDPLNKPHIVFEQYLKSRWQK